MRLLMVAMVWLSLPAHGVEAAQRMLQIVQSNCQTNQEIQQDAQQLMQSILNIFSDGGANDN